MNVDYHGNNLVIYHFDFDSVSNIGRFFFICQYLTTQGVLVTKLPMGTEIDAKAESEGFKKIEADNSLPFLALWDIFPKF